ncbi:MAG TPA: hypothetical protein VK806_05895 [Bacteroidia bacterium]|nr:hypothetical protein [Bacteroidia bacterium]
MEIVPLKCTVCGAAIENYHGQSEVKCSYCGAIQEIEPEQLTPVRNKTTLTAAIIILGIIVLFGAISVSLDMGAKHLSQPVVTKDSITNRNKDTNKESPKKVDNGDPLSK